MHTYIRLYLLLQAAPDVHCAILRILITLLEGETSAQLVAITTCQMASHVLMHVHYHHILMRAERVVRTECFLVHNMFMAIYK